MKHLKKLYAVAMAVVMAMVLSVTAYAVDAKQIEITLPADPAENTYTYKIYKVFDATSNGSAISYKLVSGKTEAPVGFEVDTAGNVTYTGATTEDGELTAAAIEAIANYVTDSDYVTEVSGKANEAGNATVTVTLEDYGFYYITTSTGSVVTIDSTNPGAEVRDKNTVPTVVKVISDASSYDEDGKKALAQVGTDVEFTATITVGAGSTNLVFHDTMETSLDYNDDAAVTGVNADAYEILATPAQGDTITIKFDDDIAAGTVITVTYSATVTDAALQTDPAKNTATVSYGDEGKYSSLPSEADVYNAKISVIKYDGNKANAHYLGGAGFVIANADEKYYQMSDEGIVNWVDSIDDATEYTSNATDGKLDGEFTGLADGTYTLIEKTVPAGYNKAADTEFSIAAHDYSAGNLMIEAEVENNAGTELPSTGGIGTTLFYVIGGILVAGAAIALVVKNRVAKIEE